MSFSAFSLFYVIVLCAVYDLHICSVSELLLGRLLTRYLKTRASEIFCGLFSLFLQPSSKEIWRSFTNILKRVRFLNAYLPYTLLLQ